MSKSSCAADADIVRAIAEQAAEWFIAHREQRLSLDERQAFLSWLQASPLHVREYLLVARLSLNLHAVAHAALDSPEALIAAAQHEEPPVVVELNMLGRHQSQMIGRRLVALAATVAVVAIGVILTWRATQAPHLDEYRTVHGEQRTVRLDDGSVLHVNSDSVVYVEFSAKERVVSMERGQALFKVAKDKARPFRVLAGATEVVAVGTEFDVRRSADDVLVTVVEGQVAVTELEKSQHETSDVVATPLRLAAGQQARVVPGTPPVVSTEVDVRPAVAWVYQQIIFERETLREVVEEFNRYGTVRIVVEDSELASVRISGVFNAYDVESFVGYLQQVSGIKVHRDLDSVHLSIEKNNGERP